ncbi:putative DNA binding domain-containing protein [Candidatus Woesearchaeota archaeon]|nr:putative DNA binding domain-containing protein [Candidatus Woesearchaeota archaeon]
MLKNKIVKIIKGGEGPCTEFKECKTEINKSVYETVCAFLNRNGGELLLGVNDSGEITGIDKDYIGQIKKDFVTAINNPQKITPAVYFSIEQVQIQNKQILYFYVPESSQVHKCNGKIYDRNEDGDIDITNNQTLVTSLYTKKQNFYTENTVYPYCKLTDLREDLINKARTLALNQNSNHPWKNMSNMKMLKSAKLYSKDYATNKEGFTLACILLFGKDETILSAVPHHKTDLILRKIDLDRYDDRDDVRTNLIESYERILAFGQKHLSDPFYLEGTQRISIRDKIMREIASNILIHREYFNPFPAKIIIEKDRIYSENSNKPHVHGIINPKNFTPYPKNPVIAGVFKQIGNADDLGSGVRNLVKYTKLYSHREPEIHDEDIFKVIIPIPQGTMEATMEATTQDERMRKIIEFSTIPRTAIQIMEMIGLKNKEHFRLEILKPLIEKKILLLTIPDKPNSPKQKYCSKQRK